MFSLDFWQAADEAAKKKNITFRDLGKELKKDPYVQKRLKEVREDDRGKHYRFEYKGIKLDPFRIACIYNLDGVGLTILKKNLVTGNRGHKDKKQDYLDIICAAQRGIEMLEEDGNT